MAFNMRGNVTATRHVYIPMGPRLSKYLKLRSDLILSFPVNFTDMFRKLRLILGLKLTEATMPHPLVTQYEGWCVVGKRGHRSIRFNE